MSRASAEVLVRSFERLDPAVTSGQTLILLGSKMQLSGRLGVIVDTQGRPLSCISAAIVQQWPEDQPLQALADRWPPLLALPETEAGDVAAVAWFFRDDLFEHQRIPAVVLVSPEGQPTALLPRRPLVDALAGPDVRHRSPSTGTDAAPSFATERDLMVPRAGQLHFPAHAPIHQPTQLTVSIRRQITPGQPGQVELGLTARQWPVYVTATVDVLEEDFRVEGSNAQVIKVDREGDSAIHTFTLTPLRLGLKTIRVRFELNNTYLNTAKLTTQVVAIPPHQVGAAPMTHAPPIMAKLTPPDITLYVTEAEIASRTYAISARLAGDDPVQAAGVRELGRFRFPDDPRATIEALFADLDAKSKRGLSAGAFDAMVRKIGSSLFDMLSQGNRLREFYWEVMHDRATTVQIVSQEPYIPWEIVRPNRRLPDGRWESAPYLCQNFALARWLVDGEGPVDRMPLRQLTLVLPPSNLKFVQKEAEALQGLLGLNVELIGDKLTLEQVLCERELHALHFACHGQFAAESPARSEVYLEGNASWRPFELTAEYRNFGRARPLVFLNACDTGRIGFGLTGLDGWAEAFLNAGAGVFIGAMWRIDDRLAAEFAACFYEQISRGVPVGEAVRTARSAVSQSGDATWLSYTLYANPAARAIIVGQQS